MFTFAHKSPGRLSKRDSDVACFTKLCLVTRRLSLFPINILPAVIDRSFTFCAGPQRQQHCFTHSGIDCLDCDLAVPLPIQPEMPAMFL